MDTLLDFLRSDQVKGILLALFIFFVTIFLVVKRWIGFSATFLFLLFALATAFIVNHHTAFNTYLTSQPASSSKTQNDAFEKQIHQAVEDLTAELKSEKEQLNHLVKQVQELLIVVEAEKIKLDHFISETKEHFHTDPAKTGTPEHSAS